MTRMGRIPTDQKIIPCSFWVSFVLFVSFVVNVFSDPWESVPSVSSVFYSSPNA